MQFRDLESVQGTCFSIEWGSSLFFCYGVAILGIKVPKLFGGESWFHDFVARNIPTLQPRFPDIWKELGTLSSRSK